MLGKFKVEVDFFTHFDAEGYSNVDLDNPIWWIVFRVKYYRDMEVLGHYTVVIYDKTQEMELYSAEDSKG